MNIRRFFLSLALSLIVLFVYLACSGAQGLGVVLYWAASVVLCLFVIVYLEAKNLDFNSIGGWGRFELLLLIALLLLAALIRAHGVGDFPLQLHNDEMNTGISARSFLKSPLPNVFATGWWGQPGMGFFLTSIWMRVLGDSLLGLRMSSVFYSLFFLLGLYLLVRALFGRRIAFLALALTLTLPIHLHFSRTGFQQMQSLAFSMWALVCYILALKSRSSLLFAISGVFLGISFQTYTVAFLVPIVVTGVTLLALLRRNISIRAGCKAYLTHLVFTLVTFAPLFCYYINHPGTFASRARNEVFVFSDHNRPFIQATVGSLRAVDVAEYQLKHTLSFIYPGKDTSVEFGYQGPLIASPILPFFILGVVISLTRAATIGSFTILAWVMGTLLLGGALTINSPYGPRLVGISALVMVFVAQALEIVRLKLRPWLSWAADSIIVLFVIGIMVIQGMSYFISYANYAPVARRDIIARMAAQFSGLQSIVNLMPQEELFEHEAYIFNVPGATRVNRSDLLYLETGFLEELRRWPRPVLLLLPEELRAMEWIQTQITRTVAPLQSTCSVESKLHSTAFGWCLLR